MTTNGFVYIKAINIKASIEKYLSDLHEEGASPEKVAMLSVAITSEYKAFLDFTQSQVKFQINDNMDIIVSLSQKKKKFDAKMDFQIN